MTTLRNAQGLTLGLGRAAAVTVGTLAGTLMRDSMLMDPIVSASGFGLITDMAVAGQNLNVSSDGAPWQMWSAQAQAEGYRSLGIPLEQQQPFTMDYVFGAPVNISAGVNTDPISPDEVVPVDSLGQALNYFGGFGQFPGPGIAAGADATLTTTVRRAVKLGLISMVGDPTALAADLTVRSIQVNNIELLCGGDTPVQREVPLEALSQLCTDTDGRMLGYEVAPNSVIDIVVHNYNAGALLCGGGFFCMPIVPQS